MCQNIMRIFYMTIRFLVLFLMLVEITQAVLAQGVRTESLEYNSPIRQSSYIEGTKDLCPDSITVIHKLSDGVSPVNVTITYGVVQTHSGDHSKCWITRNLGALKQASVSQKVSSDCYGWFWQFNRKQGHPLSFVESQQDSARELSNKIDENYDWSLSKDPCRILLGGTWHIPTMMEWKTTAENEELVNLTTAYTSPIRLYACPYVSFNLDGSSCGCTDCLSLWSSTTMKKRGIPKGIYGYTIGVDPTIFMSQDYSPKKQSLALRCVMDL